MFNNTIYALENTLGFLILVTDIYSYEIMEYNFSDSLATEDCPLGLLSTNKYIIYKNIPFIHYCNRGL